MNEVCLKEKNRNYGIDLLRVIAMFFVVTLHCFGKGGILSSAVINSSQYKIAWFIEIFAYSAVDIFALISGYVSYTEKDKEVKYSKYLNLWFQVVFYGILINIIFNIINPTLVSIKSYIKVLLPVSFNLYWYFTAYTGLFIVMPLLNKSIRNCSEQLLKKLFVVIIIAFSIYNLVFNVFALQAGYSFLWIMILYILGAIMKKCNIGSKLKNWHIILGITILLLFTFIYKIYGISFFRINKDTFVSYVSPTILGISILYIIGFSRIKFNSFMKKIISFAGPSAFTVYILNNHPLIWQHVMNGLFISIANASIIKLIVYPLSFAILFTICSILIDRLRIVLFKFLNINKLSTYIVNISSKVLDKIIKLY